MRVATTKANSVYWQLCLKGLTKPLYPSVYRRYEGYGLKVGGGRTRIRTRVFGLEGQSDIQTTLYVLNRCDGLPLKKVTID